MRQKDIAKAAGVSISTVSRVLNDFNSRCASQETKDLIRKLALDNGYSPPSSNQPDSSGSCSSHIYCMIATDPKEYSNDSFYSTLVSALRIEAQKYSASVEYYFPGPAPENQNVDVSCGLIIIGRFQKDILEELHQKFQNIVYVGLNHFDKVDCDQIVCDGYYAAREVVSRLCSVGHKQIGFIGAGDDSRLHGFLHAMEQCHLSVHRNNVINDIALSSEGGYDGMLRLLDNSDEATRPTAVFCANDMTAIGAVRACRDRGIRIPDDVGIVGMNDLDILNYYSPAVSTVHVPLEEMGAMAIKILVDRFNTGHQQPVEVRFPYWIISRESCKI